MYYKAKKKIVYESKPNKRIMCGDGRLEKLSNAPESPNMRAIYVRFEACGYTKWHWHEGTQLLYGTKGRGFVELQGMETEKGKGSLPIEIGTRVLIPAGVWHRHGATSVGRFEHLAVTEGKTHWKEKSACDKYPDEDKE